MFEFSILKSIYYYENKQNFLIFSCSIVKFEYNIVTAQDDDTAEEPTFSFSGSVDTYLGQVSQRTRST